MNARSPSNTRSLLSDAGTATGAAREEEEAAEEEAAAAAVVSLCSTSGDEERGRGHAVKGNIVQTVREQRREESASASVEWRWSETQHTAAHSIHGNTHSMRDWMGERMGRTVWR